MAENFGMAFLSPLGEMQRQDIERQKAPFEIQHMQSLSRLQKAQADSAELQTTMARQGSKALEGFQFDAKDPTKSLLEMAGRVAPSQPVLAEKVIQAAQMSSYRDAAAQAAKAQAAQRMMATAKGKMDALFSAYADLPSLDEESLGLARQQVSLQFQSMGADPQEIQEATQMIENGIKKHGLAAVKWLHDRGMSAYQQAQTAMKTEEEARKKKREQDLEEHRKERERLAREKEERLATQAAAREKAGGGTGSRGSAGGKEGRPRYPGKDLLSTSVAAVEGDPLLSTGDKGDKLSWARRVAEKTQAKVDASHAERQKNPNVPLLSWDDARTQALSEVKAAVKQEPGVLDNLLKRPGPAKQQRDITQADYAKLKKGDKFWFGGKEHVKE